MDNEVEYILEVLGVESLAEAIVLIERLWSEVKHEDYRTTGPGTISSAVIHYTAILTGILVYILYVVMR